MISKIVDLRQQYLHNVIKFKHYTTNIFSWIDKEHGREDSMVGLASISPQMHMYGNHFINHGELSSKVLWWHFSRQKKEWQPLKCKVTMFATKPKSF